MKKMSTGFKVTVSALLAIMAILSIAIAGLFYWQGIKNKEQEKLRKQIAAFEKTITGMKKSGTSGTETGTTVTEDKYKGWQAYTNQAYKISARYPAGWTYNETSGSLHVEFLGPETSGGVITHECGFRIFVEDAGPGTSLNNYVDAAQNEPMGGGNVVEEGATTIAGNTAYKVVDTYSDVGHKWQRMRIWTIKNNRAYTFTYDASTNYNSTDYYTMHLAEAELWLASISID